jgi:hypothetical protein
LLCFEIRMISKSGKKPKQVAVHLRIRESKEADMCGLRRLCLSYQQMSHPLSHFEAVFALQLSMKRGGIRRRQRTLFQTSILHCLIKQLANLGKKA